MNSRDITFGDIEVDRNPIAFQRRNRTLDFDRIFTARKILLFQLLLRLIQHCAIKNPRLSQAVVLQGFAQLILIEVFGPIDIDLIDRWTFINDHDQGVAVRLQLHITEETGSKQSLDRSSRLVVIEAITHANRQVVEHRTGFSTLHPFDLDILDGKWLDRVCGSTETGRNRQH